MRNTHHLMKSGSEKHSDTMIIIYSLSMKFVWLMWDLDYVCRVAFVLRRDLEKIT